MIDFNRYFIVGTNSDALHDTMNGIVTGKLILCKDCKYNSNMEGNYVNCAIIPQMFGKTPDNNYCSYAEPKDTTEEVRKQLKDMEQRREMDRKK